MSKKRSKKRNRGKRSPETSPKIVSRQSPKQQKKQRDKEMKIINTHEAYRDLINKINYTKALCEKRAPWWLKVISLNGWVARRLYYHLFWELKEFWNHSRVRQPQSFAELRKLKPTMESGNYRSVKRWMKLNGQGNPSKEIPYVDIKEKDQNQV